VRVAEGKGFEDQEVECTLEEVEAVRGHGEAPCVENRQQDIPSIVECQQ
jgi:hypothetical protein